MHTVIFNSARQSDRVHSRKAAYDRVIVSIAVVMQPSLRIKVLALEPDVVLHRFHFVLHHVAVNFIASLPHHLALLVGDQLRGAEVVVVVVVDLAVFDLGQGNKTARFVQVGDVDVLALFGQ